MNDSIADLMGKLKTDPWRKQVGFSPEVQAALEVALYSKSEDDIAAALNTWISKYQPCLFGRIAAKHVAITFCLIPEEMLYGSENELGKHIQEARLRWTRAGFEGKSSNFVITVLSPKLAFAVPSETVKQIALRICSLYLQEPVESDRIYSDRLWLEQPGSRRTTWEWVVGANYFSAQGDRRWWQDHRFPAGMAFSMNSVGHMVKSGKLMRAVHDLEELMGTSLGDYSEPRIDSLEKGLELAMRTISYASDTVSGKATFLVPVEETPADARPTCPIKLPTMISGMDYCSYKGFYHTDYTIPSEYFLPDVTRPENIRARELDFTYLFHKDLDNPDFDRMRRRAKDPDGRNRCCWRAEDTLCRNQASTRN